MNIVKVWVDRDFVHILTAENEELREPVSRYGRLRNATLGQLQNYETDRFGIRWPDLDEDLCFDCFPREYQLDTEGSCPMAAEDLCAYGVSRAEA